MERKKILVGLIVCLFYTHFLAAQTNFLVVPPGTPGVTPTSPWDSWDIAETDLVAMVNHASVPGAGNTICISNGTYFLTNQLNASFLTITGLNGAAATVLTRTMDITNRIATLSNSVIGGVTVSNGLARDGAGLYLVGSMASNCVLIHNIATNMGGGLYLTNSYAVNCLVNSNRAARGGGVAVASYSNFLYNCTVVGNTATASVGGVYAWTNALGSTGYVHNSIVYFNQTLLGSASNIINTDITAGYLVFSNSCVAPTNGMSEGNIELEPQFINYAARNCRLCAGSPCLDAGLVMAWMTGAKDLDGLPRIVGAGVDMGAYERPNMTIDPLQITNKAMLGFATGVTFSISSVATDLAWSVSSVATWIGFDATQGVVGESGTAQVRMTNDSADLSSGQYDDVVLITGTNLYYTDMIELLTVCFQVMELEVVPLQITNLLMQSAVMTDTVSVRNIGAGVMSWSATTNVNWLVLSGVAGVLTGQTDWATNNIVVTFTNTSLLPIGTNFGAITVQAEGGRATQIVDVALIVNARPDLRGSPGSIYQTVMQGQTVPSNTLTIWNGSDLYGIFYNVTTNMPWLQAGVSTGYLGPLQTNFIGLRYYGVANLSALGDTPSNYYGRVTVTATNVASGSPRNIDVSLRVNPRARMALNTHRLTNSVVQGRDADSRRFEIWNTNRFYTLEWTLSDNAGWLVPRTSAGSSTGQMNAVVLDFSTVGLPSGVRTSVVTVVGRAFDGLNRDAALDATQRVEVVLTVLPHAVLASDLQTVYRREIMRGHDAGSFSFNVWNASSAPRGRMRYQVAAESAWLNITGAVGVSTGEYQQVRVYYDAGRVRNGVWNITKLRLTAVDESAGGSAVGSPMEAVVEFFVRIPRGYDFGGGGSGASDLVLYREQTGEWRVLNLLSEYSAATEFGGYGFQPAPGDYNGNGLTQLGVYRSASGGWYVREMADTEVSGVVIAGWVGEPYRVISGDYDGDGKADPAVYHEETGLWRVLMSGNAYREITGIFGGRGYQVLPGYDFDGDGKIDPALYHQETGLWEILFSRSAYAMVSGVFGGAGYEPAVADYDGDSLADPALFNRSTGEWIILPSTTLTSRGYTIFRRIFGGPGVSQPEYQRPAPADYDGDGLADLAFYDSRGGYWYIMSFDGSIVAWKKPHGGFGFEPLRPW